MAAWAAGGESELIEFKETTGSRDAGGKTTCAMLNGRGGRVLYGVTPAGRVAGQQVSDRTLEELAATFKSLQPEAQPRIDRVPVDGERTVLVVTVQPGRLKPYLYKGAAYRRVGATTTRMTADEYQRMVLEQAHADDRWEIQPSPLTLGQLGTKLIEQTIKEGVLAGRFADPLTRDPRELLLGMGLLRNGTLTHAAAVLFGLPEALEVSYPQCLARLARFDGVDKADRLSDERQVHDHAFGLITEIEGFLRRHLQLATRLDPDELTRKDSLEIPVLALREAIANALAHREYHQAGGSITVAVYDDRVEIASTGGLHFGLSADSLYAPHEPLPWNPQIAQILYRRGIVDSLGSGTLRMVREARNAGLAAPIIEDTGTSVRVIFPRRGFPSPLLRRFGLTAEQLRVLDGLAVSDATSRSELIDRSGVAERAVRSALDRLRDYGLADFSGEKRGARWRLVGVARRAYGLPPNVER